MIVATATLVDWEAITAAVDRDGYAVTRAPLLDGEDCAQLRNAFDDGALYRSTVDMGRHRFGEGCYRYYAYPLPAAVAAVREEAYPPLAALANAWAQRLGDERRLPDTLYEFVDQCRAAGQYKPTPLILRYHQGGYNALHQDLYGDVAFPLQLTVALSRPWTDFTGGENVLVEQRPRAQSRATAITVPLGHALVFPTRYRPVSGTRGAHRTAMRHGVSAVTSGTRFALGLIFHDAR